MGRTPARYVDRIVATTTRSRFEGRTTARVGDLTVDNVHHLARVDVVDVVDVGMTTAAPHPCNPQQEGKLNKRSRKTP